MDNKKASRTPISGDYSMEDLTDASASDPSDSYMKKIKNLYLPHSKDDYKPSEESIEDANNLSHPKPPSPNSLN
ncbi:hypothetical protein CDLVIII_5683 [Clostridium sp. DL-VIII]|uniref:hypothetical protein n=1 Tax=Clostridium sp. DL-VIII TaxID=641107 RepID=UPI00023B0795|nr:hypothetical protein [Clostridium sp. DL-VIII]EHJ02153.1 hypothetical protein CDLVIII_5683 [Clostridium sp. DL-VIII]